MYVSYDVIHHAITCNRDIVIKDIHLKGHKIVTTEDITYPFINDRVNHFFICMILSHNGLNVMQSRRQNEKCLNIFE